MAELKDVTVSLRVFGDDLDPSEVSQLLDAEPSNSRRAGDATQFRSGPDCFDSGAWFLQAEGRGEAGLETQIRAILDATTSDLERWRELLNRYDVDLFCGLFLDAEDANQGVELSPDLLSELGARGLLLGLDLYGDAGSE